MIYDLVKEIKEDQKDIVHKITSQSECLIRVESDVRRNADDLQEHMRRTEILEKLHNKNSDKISDIETNIEELKQPQIIKKAITSKVLKTAGLITAVAGMVLTVLKVLDLLK